MHLGTAARHITALLYFAGAACGGDPWGAPPPAQIRVAGGDHQIAPIDAWLPDPIVVTVADADGLPAVGTPVEWSLTGDGELTPINRTTDRHGQARAQWLLGSTEGVNTATAKAPGLDPVLFTAVAEPRDALPFGELHPIDIATYEGSHQVVHPDYAAAPAGAFGLPQHLAITPYPFGNAKYENPSLFSGTRLDVWELAPGVPNPIVLPDQGYLSDPDLVYVPELEELWLYYRQVTSDNIVQLVRSRNGREWSAPVEVARAPNHGLVSPSVVRRAADDWWMFSVNSGPVGCSAAATTVEVRRSADGLHWSAPAPAELAQPDLWPWHIDVQWIPSRNAFWAIYNAKTKGGCTTPAVFIATSTDGLTWQPVAKPVLAKGRAAAFQDIVYRSTFAYDPGTDALTLWYSGARYDGGRYVWSAAVERRQRADLFDVKLKALNPTLFVPAPAPLTDWP